MKKRTFGFNTSKMKRKLPKTEVLQKKLKSTFGLFGANTSYDFAIEFDKNIAKFEN